MGCRIKGTIKSSSNIEVSARNDLFIVSVFFLGCQILIGAHLWAQKSVSIGGSKVDFKVDCPLPRETTSTHQFIVVSERMEMKRVLS